MNCLFTEGKIGTMILKNRIIMTAIHTGYPVEKETAFLAGRAKGGAAAVTAVMGVSKTGAYANMCVLEPEKKATLQRMAAVIHEESGKLIVQLFHAGRNGAKGMLADREAQPVAPSPVPSPIYKEIPRELTTKEIQEIVREFGRAALLCRESGIDGVEISCSAGYLLSQFFSPLTNQRTDQYGGDPENRLRFPLEVIREVRSAAGCDYPVILRVSAGDMLGGYGIKDTVELVKRAEEYIDAVNVTGGWHESPVPQISMHLPEGGFAFLAREVKKSIKLPVIACNRINNGETALEIIERGYGDFVGCARAFLTASSFTNKLAQGVPYRRCIGCNKGCIERVLKMQEAACIFNPETGREGEKPVSVRGDKRRTLIVGGGPAGMEAALQCAKRGDSVQLCTDGDMVGGLLHAAAQAPFKDTIADNIAAMRAELEQSNVQLRYGILVDPVYIEKENPDLVIVATGSKPSVPPIPGINLSHVLTAQQLLLDGNCLKGASGNGKIVIIGGGSVGLETALYLAQKSRLKEAGKSFLKDFAKEDIRKGLDCGSDITVIEMGEKPGADLGGLRRTMLQLLKSYGVEIKTGAVVEEVYENSMRLRKDGKSESIDAEMVVLAAGYRSQGLPLVEWLEKDGRYPYRVIGDAAKVGNIGKALLEANEAAHQ